MYSARTVKFIFIALFILLAGLAGVVYRGTGSFDGLLFALPLLLIGAGMVLGIRPFLILTLLFIGAIFVLSDRSLSDKFFVSLVLLGTAVVTTLHFRQAQQKWERTREEIEALQKENAQLQKQIQALFQRETEAHDFQKKLQTLHRISIELARLTDETELYRTAVEYGRYQLGFDRLTILLFDEKKEFICGTFGTDEQGRTVDERHFRKPIADWALRHIYEEQKRAILLEDVPLYTEAQEVGTGWNAITVIWGGGQSIGWLVTDNLIQQKEPDPFQLEILSLYGASLGQIIAQRKSEAILRESEADARRFQDKLQALHEIGLNLSQASTLKELYYQAVYQGVHELGYERLALLLYDPGTNDMIGTFGTNHLGEIVDETHFKQQVAPNFSLINLLTEQKRLSVRESATLYTGGKPAGQGWRATSVLWNGQEGLGWLSIDNLISGEPLKPHQLEILYLYGATLGNLITMKRSAKAIQSYAAELERSNRELQEFAYAASHDLQEPLRKIQTFGGRLQSRYAPVLDARGVDYLNRMQDAAVRMQTLIEDLLAYSRVKTHQQPFASVSLPAVLQGVLSDLETRIEATKAEVLIGELPEIEADPTQMRQLFQNLLGNALKFQRADVLPVIEVWGELLADHSGEEGICRIYVKDNGIGIEEQFAERIFGVFQRLHGRTEYEGSGVGLAVCRRICERHRGRIWVESELNAGSTFVIDLPVRQVVDSASPF